MMAMKMKRKRLLWAEWNWGKKTVMVPNPWGRGVEESYDFDVTKSDKLFDFLLEKGQIKLPDGHVMLPPDQLKNKKFYKFHNTTSHSTNECRIFWQHIQRAIQQGRLKFDTPRKMKVDDNPFPRDQNMVDARLLKGNTKVLTSTRAKEAGTIDPVVEPPNLMPPRSTCLPLDTKYSREHTKLHSSVEHTPGENPKIHIFPSESQMRE